jgi:hypothetical protein
MNYPRDGYWRSQTPAFRENALSLLVDAERGVAARERSRKDRARMALANIEAAVQMWDWVPERGDVLTYVQEGLS